MSKQELVGRLRQFTDNFRKLKNLTAELSTDSPI
jgi:hypothetical protein